MTFDSIRRAYESAQKALTNYLQAMEELDKVYNVVLDGLKQKYPDFQMDTDRFGTELLSLNKDRSKSAFLIANFFGDEVFASLSLLLCLEVCHMFDYQIFAVPIASKFHRDVVDASLREAVLQFIETQETDLVILFSQKHPYLDGFYIHVPFANNRIDRSKQILSEVAKCGHEVGAYSVRRDRPFYAIVKADDDELISVLANKGIEAYRFVVSQDIWAGYRAVLTLLKPKS